jgi:hypothetical protein
MASYGVSHSVAGGRGACGDAGELCGVWPGLGAVCMAAAGPGFCGQEPDPMGDCGHACALVSTVSS